jgi:hypothetical protein
MIPEEFRSSLSRVRILLGVGPNYRNAYLPEKRDQKST